MVDESRSAVGSDPEDMSHRTPPSVDIVKRLDSFHGLPRCVRWDGCTICDAAYEIEILYAREARRG